MPGGVSVPDWNAAGGTKLPGRQAHGAQAMPAWMTLGLTFETHSINNLYHMNLS